MTSLTDAPVATSTGSHVQQQMALMKARSIARYKLTAVPGRPEELVRKAGIRGNLLGISFGYGCKTIRVRKMIGRRWTDHVDFQIGEGWGAELFSWLDHHFGTPAPSPLSIAQTVWTGPADHPGRGGLPLSIPHPMDSFPTHIDKL